MPWYKLPLISSRNTARRGLERWPFLKRKQRYFEKFAFTRAVWMSKIHHCLQAICDDFMVGEFGAIVKRNGFYSLRK